jgi:hypothetical protein
MENKDKTQNFFADLLSVSLSDYLIENDFTPISSHNGHTYFQSPFSQKHPAVLLVNDQYNTWYCKGTGKNGNIIDLLQYTNGCSIPEALTILKAYKVYLPDERQVKKQEAQAKSAIHILDIKNKIKDPKILDYLKELNLPVAIANQYFKEIGFMQNGIFHRGMGTDTSKNSPLIHVPYLGSCYSDTGYTFFKGGADKINVFTSHTDLLHAAKIFQRASPSSSMLLFTDLKAFEQARAVMECHKQINLYLPNTPEGKQYIGYGEWLSVAYKDYSQLYPRHQNLTAMQQERHMISNDKKQRKGKHL